VVLVVCVGLVVDQWSVWSQLLYLDPASHAGIGIIAPLCVINLIALQHIQPYGYIITSPLPKITLEMPPGQKRANPLPTVPVVLSSPYVKP
jgi:hypothetical protein